MARSGLELIVCPQRFPKIPFSSVHTYTRKQRFQKVPLWKAFSKSSVSIYCFHRIRVDGSRIRKEQVAFSNENGYVWTGPKLSVTSFQVTLIRCIEAKKCEINWRYSSLGLLRYAKKKYFFTKKKRALWNFISIVGVKVLRFYECRCHGIKRGSIKPIRINEYIKKDSK